MGSEFKLAFENNRKIDFEVSQVFMSGSPMLRTGFQLHRIFCLKEKNNNYVKDENAGRWFKFLICIFRIQQHYAVGY